MKILVTADRAAKLLNDIPHNTCRSAIGAHWRMGDDGTPTAASFLWPYCWGMTGTNSERAKTIAAGVFTEIFGRRVEDIRAHGFHEWAKHGRYVHDLTDSKLMGRSA